MGIPTDSADSTERTESRQIYCALTGVTFTDFSGSRIFLPPRFRYNQQVVLTILRLFSSAFRLSVGAEYVYTNQNMTRQPVLIAADLEGVFLPEIWISVAERTQLPELRLTTRDVPDYDRLMHYRMEILDRHGLTLSDIQAVIGGMEPLPGAVEFLDWMRSRTQVIIITDSFYEFVAPFLPKLHFPTVFAHTLEINEHGALSGFRLRLPDGKRLAAESFAALGFRVLAMGDSYNDVGMLAAAEQGILFHPPANVVAEFPNFPVAYSYADMQTLIEQFLDKP